jgi:large repetitive protein
MEIDHGMAREDDSMRRVGRDLLRAVAILLVVAAVGPVSSALAEGTVTIEPFPGLGKVAPRIEGTAGTAEGDASTVSVKIYKEGAIVASGNPLVISGEWSTTPSVSESGLYTVKAIQENGTEEQIGSAEGTFRIDATKPPVTMNAVASPINNATPTLQGAAGADEGDNPTVAVTIYQGKSVGGTIAASANPERNGGTWSYVPSRLADGTYTAQAIQEDWVENKGTSAAVTFTVETEAPKVTLKTPTSPSNNTKPSFEGTATNATQPVTVEVHEGSEAGPVVAKATAPGTGAAWKSVAASPALTPNEGPNTYTAVAIQKPTLSGIPEGKSPSVTFVVNTLTMTPPASHSNNKSPSFSGTTGETTTVDVKIYKGSTPTGSTVAEVTAAPEKKGLWTSGAVSHALEDGRYTAQATEPSSISGNPPAVSAPATFVVNSHAPTVTLNSLGAWSNNSSPSFSGTASEKGQPVEVKIHAGTVKGPVVSKASALGNGGVWSSGNASPALADGQYTATAVQTSALGEEDFGESEPPIAFTVDTIPPSVMLSSPPNGSSTTSSSQLITGSAGTAVGDIPEVTVQLFSGPAIVAGQSPLQSVNVTAAAGTWSTTVAGLGPGTYSVRAEQADDAHNVGVSASSTFTVSGSAASARALTASFSWVPSSPHTGESVSLLSSSTDASSPITSYAWDVLGSGAFAAGGPVMSTSFATPGRHLVQLRVGDAGGMSSVASEAIEVTPPSLHLMRPFPIVRLTATRVSSGVRLKLLSVQASSAAKVTVACHGHGCPVKSQTRAASAGKVRSSTVGFRRLERFLPAGVTLEIRISKAGVIGKYTRFAIRRGKPPVRFDACLAPTSIKPMACPSS